MSESKCQKCAELETELERVERQSAAMREALKSVREMISRYLVATKGRVSNSWLDGFIECGAVTIDGIGYIKPVTCDPDAGTNYVSKKHVRPLVEACNRWLIGAPSAYSFPAETSEFICECQARMKSALANARAIGL